MILDVIWIWCIKLWIPEFLGVDMVLTERREISPLVYIFNCLAWLFNFFVKKSFRWFLLELFEFLNLFFWALGR